MSKNSPVRINEAKHVHFRDLAGTPHVAMITKYGVEFLRKDTDEALSLRVSVPMSTFKTIAELK